MTFEEAREHARQGTKVTHRYFTSEEYMTMKGNMIIFEDGVKVHAGDWMEGKDYLNEDWSLFKNNKS